MTARFIALEGGEAAGKSTQADRLAARLGAVRTHEPGGTALGQALRQLFLDPETGSLAARAEVLLMAADRAQHVSEVVGPALAVGRPVVTDRYLYSSVAYQGSGRGLAPDEIAELNRWATEGLRPDVVVLLDVPVVVARARLGVSARDRLEAEDDDFHERVRQGFLAQAAADRGRWVVVDASRPADEVEAAVWAAVASHCPELAAAASSGPVAGKASPGAE